MIQVVVGDLAREAVDAVVRCADATLAPVGDSAAHLDELGGDDFAAQRRTATPLEAGAAVVTAAGIDKIRRALVSAWQRAGDWGLARVAAPLVGTANGELTVEASAELLRETFPGPEGRREPPELRIVVDAPAQRDAVEAIVRRKS